MPSEGSILTSLGIGAVEAAMAIPSLYKTPSDSDDNDQGDAVIIRGAKKGLAKAGYDVSSENKFRNALLAVVGKGWPTTQWTTILGKIREAIEKYYSTIKLPTVPAGTKEPLYKNPLVLVAGAAALYLLLGKGKR